MRIPFPSLLNLLHAVGFGTLATQSLELPGYPFASLLPYVMDARHRPVFLISALAEHTRNLLADPRASLLVHHADARNVLAAERASLLGDVTRIEPTADVVARYLRYQPDAERYLALGDFAFFRMTPRAARYVGGFGRMGWIGDAEWGDASLLVPGDEVALLESIAGKLPEDTAVGGIDCYGIDLLRAGARERLPFPDGPLSFDMIKAAAEALLPRT